MSRSIGQPVVIENMPGAGGATAAPAVARAAPDGHTLLWVSEPERDRAVDVQVAAVRLVDATSRRSATMATFDFVLIVPARTARSRPCSDVIAAAKSDPDKFNFGSIAVGTAQNLSALKFAVDGRI